MRNVCVVAGLMLLATAAQAQIAVKDTALVHKTKALAVDVHYPVTGKPEIDRLLAGYARARMNEVSPADAASDPSGNGYAVNVAYKVTRNDAKFFSVLFTGWEYTGGAHPNPFEESFVFLMPDGAQIFLPELVDGKRGLEKVSSIAIADLKKRLLGPNGPSQAGWIEGGASPTALAHVAFEWQPKELVLTFGAYAVAAYVAGRQVVHIPLTAIADVVRPDPRAPAPSFDCKRAASRIEKALCANAALARQDRQVAEAYADALAINSEKKAQLLAAQRDWLKRRDQDCASAGPACLSRAYQQRLAALKPPAP